MAGSDNDSDNASIHNEAINTQQQPNIQLEIITTVSNNNAKFPYFKKDEYEVWAMKMEYWITNNDMNIWKVIQHGNSMKRTERDHDGRVIIRPLTTAEEHIAVQRESKARTTLLQSIPDDHQEFLEFRISEAEGLHKGYDKIQKILSSLNLKTKGGLELLSFDDLYYKLKTLEVDVKGYTTFSSSQSAGPSHFTFVSIISASKKMSYGDSPYFEHMEKLDLEEMDLKWQMAILSVRVHKTDHDDEGDEVITTKEFGMIAGCNFEDAIKEGAAKIYNLITGTYTEEATTAGDVGEFTLMGVTSKTDFHSDKSSEVNTNDFASSDFSVKSLEHKPNDSTSCALTSSVSTSGNEAEIESNVRTPIKGPISVQDLPTFTCNSSDKNEHTSKTSCNTNGYFKKKAVPTGKPKVKPVPISKPKVKPVATSKPKVTPVPTGKPHVSTSVHTSRPNRSQGIKREYSNPRTPQQNETKAVRTACYVLNRVSVTSPHNKTPYDLLTGNIPFVSHCKPFGCHVTILNTSDHLGKFDGKADEGYIVGYSASNKAYRVYNVPNKRVEESMNLRFLEEKPNVQGLGHACVNRSETKATYGTPVDDSPFPSADEIFQKELAKLKGQEQRVTSDAEILGLGFVDNAEEFQEPTSAKTVPPGCIPVPTGSVPVPTGNLPIPTGGIPVPADATMVTTDDVPVHNSSSTDLIFDGEPTTRFPCPSDLGNHVPSPGIFSSPSYDDEFGAALNNVASTVEVSLVATQRINTIHP
nr:retrovirus-related Pol polyprotein from transposon TNT 1-94 [Tanacetum cinerariifolium]